jgi:hypothetical protein
MKRHIIAAVAIAIAGGASAQVDTITLSGTASLVPQVGGDGGPALPFSVSFTVDTNSGFYVSDPCPITPTSCGFTATDLTVTNAQGTIGGLAVPIGNGIWGGGGSGPFSEIFGAIDSGGFSPVGFHWGFDIPTLTLGPNPTLDQILRTPGYESDQSYLNGYGLLVNSVTVADPSSVPTAKTVWEWIGAFAFFITLCAMVASAEEDWRL